MRLEDRIIESVLSFVFVGEGPYSPALFDEHALFDGELDSEKTVVPEARFGQFTYCSKQYELNVTGANVTLRWAKADVLNPPPAQLVAAYTDISRTLDVLRKAIHVGAIGINSDVTLLKEQVSGNDFCLELTSSADVLLDSFPDNALQQAFLKLKCVEASNQTFEIRIEPRLASNGENLFLGFNSTYTLMSNEQIQADLNTLNEHRNRVVQTIRNICEQY